MRRFRYHYYNIKIPPEESVDKEERAIMAINDARDIARLYIMPCSWKVLRDDGNTVKVCRISNRPMKKKGLCPVCGEKIHLTANKTVDGRLIGSCMDAFTEEQWMS